jgi:hypothetical protein
MSHRDGSHQKDSRSYIAASVVQERRSRSTANGVDVASAVAGGVITYVNFGEVKMTMGMQSGKHNARFWMAGMAILGPIETDTQEALP